MRGVAAAAACVGLAMGAVSLAPAVYASLSPPPSRVVAEGAAGPACFTALRPLELHEVDLSLAASTGIIGIGGHQFDLRREGWRTQMPRHPAVTQAFHSAAWLVSLYDSDPDLAVELLLEQASVSPDPGASIGRAELKLRGWTESQVTLRTWTALCLYSRSGDRRIVGVIDALVEANLDPQRYYGPPLRAPHNHAIFANEALRAAGQMLGRSALVAAAHERLREMFDVAFDECGMTFEQASVYHAINVGLWARNLVFDSPPGAEEVMRRAKSALSALVRPDGVLEPIGDGVAGAWSPRKVRQLGISPGGELFCPRSGWAAAHRSLPSGAVQHHIVRFGPSPRYHGHEDHGSPTWWVGEEGAGVSVLADRGLHDSRRDRRHAWAVSQEAHSVFRLADQRFVGPTAGTQVSSPGRDAYRLTTRGEQGTAVRMITFVGGAPVLGVADRFASADPRSYRYVQSWQLGPAWKPASDVTARTEDGSHVLSAFCSGDGRVWAPRIREVRHFSGRGRTDAALELRCWVAPGRTASVETAIVVDDAEASAKVVDGHLEVSAHEQTLRFSAEGVLGEGSAGA